MRVGGRELDPLEVLPRFRQMAAEAGRDPAAMSFGVFGAVKDGERLKRYREAKVDRTVFMLPSEPRDKILPQLDECAKLLCSTAIVHCPQGGVADLVVTDATAGSVLERWLQCPSCNACNTLLNPVSR